MTCEHQFSINTRWTFKDKSEGMTIYCCLCRRSWDCTEFLPLNYTRGDDGEVIPPTEEAQ